MAQGDRFDLRCTGCGAHTRWDAFSTPCPACSQAGDERALWEVDYDYEAIAGAYRETVVQASAPGIWRSWPLLPVLSPNEVVTLQEGATPLLPSRQFRASGGLRVYLKNECLNPTGSFKDRYDCVSVSVARSLGHRGVACASTGNHALAVAAYAAAADLACLAIVAEGASDPVLATLKVHGAEVRVVRPEDRFAILAEEADRGWFPVGLFMPGPTSNPFGVEGYKTLAYEMVAQLGRVPDAVVFPCARGNGLYGTWKGFREFEKMGFTDSSPRMFGCQPEAAASLVRAFEAGSRTAARVQPGKTIADATNEAVSSDRALEALYESGGGALALAEAEILNGVFALGREGVFAEASSAMVWAGVEKAAARGDLRPGETVVAVVTSTGLKSGPGMVRRILDGAMHGGS